MKQNVMKNIFGNGYLYRSTIGLKDKFIIISSYFSKTPCHADNNLSEHWM